MKSEFNRAAAAALAFATTEGAVVAAAAMSREKAALADATAAARTQMTVTLGFAYLSLVDARGKEVSWFAPLVEWGMKLMDDDDALLDLFAVSRATLKRWSNGETTPGPLARDTVIVRLRVAVREKLERRSAELGEAGRRPTPADADVG